MTEVAQANTEQTEISALEYIVNQFNGLVEQAGQEKDLATFLWQMGALAGLRLALETYLPADHQTLVEASLIIGKLENDRAADLRSNVAGAQAQQPAIIPPQALENLPEPIKEYLHSWQAYARNLELRLAALSNLSTNLEQAQARPAKADTNRTSGNNQPPVAIWQRKSKKAANRPLHKG